MNSDKRKRLGGASWFETCSQSGRMAARSTWKGELKDGSTADKEMRDEYAEAMLKLIETKSSRRKDVVDSEQTEPRPAKVIDLMEVLKQSLSRGKKSNARCSLC